MEIKYNDIADEIVKKRNEWLIRAYNNPDTVIMPAPMYHLFIDELNKMVSYPTALSHKGKYKFMGMDVLESHQCNEIKVAITKPF